jgi:hypothetical protein
MVEGVREFQGDNFILNYARERLVSKIEMSEWLRG